MVIVTDSQQELPRVAPLKSIEIKDFFLVLADAAL
jgi:hypothetical protein